MLGCRAVRSLVRGRAGHRSTLRTASQGHAASQGRRPRSPTRPASPTRPPRLVDASPLARASRTASPRRRAPRLASASPLQQAGRPGKLKTVGVVARSALLPIDQLCSVGEVLSAHDEHRNRYQSQQLAESWLALGQIVGHDELEQQQLRKLPTVLEGLTEHTLQAAHTLQACHLPRAALGMAQLQRVADNALWRPTAALWSSLAARGVEVVAEFTPAQLVDTAAAFAKARSPGLTLTLYLPTYLPTCLPTYLLTY